MEAMVWVLKDFSLGFWTDTTFEMLSSIQDLWSAASLDTEGNPLWNNPKLFFFFL